MKDKNEPSDFIIKSEDCYLVIIIRNDYRTFLTKDSI